MNNKYYLYIARCKDGSLYIGISLDPDKRIIRHNTKQGAKWIQQHGGAQIAHTEEFADYSSVRKREIQLKKWSHIKKEKLIQGNL